MDDQYAAKEPKGWPDEYKLVFVPEGSFQRNRLTTMRVRTHRGRWWRPSRYGGRVMPMYHVFTADAKGATRSSPPETLVRHRTRARTRLEELLESAGSHLYAWRDHDSPLWATAYFVPGALEAATEMFFLTGQHNKSGCYTMDLRITKDSKAKRGKGHAPKKEAERLASWARKNVDSPQADAAQGVAT